MLKRRRGGRSIEGFEQEGRSPAVLKPTWRSAHTGRSREWGRDCNGIRSLDFSGGDARRFG